jgi:hypothetical protein
MTNQDKSQFSILRSILRALGLSSEAIDDIVDRINDWLSDKGEKAADARNYPYSVRDDFLSPAEQNFYLVLKTAATDWAAICPKVSLGDLFYAKSSDPAEYRVYTNKIDRKHVDFLLCDPRTARPILGIELDDRSHQRADRQERDQFVEGVFAAAKLPLVRIPVQRGYSVADLTALLREKVEPPVKTIAATAAASTPETGTTQPPLGDTQASPKCPKCGSPMVLRTAKTGANQGGKFWGCPNYPRCRGIVSFGEDS